MVSVGLLIPTGAVSDGDGGAGLSESGAGLGGLLVRGSLSVRQDRVGEYKTSWLRFNFQV